MTKHQEKGLAGKDEAKETNTIDAATLPTGIERVKLSQDEQIVHFNSALAIYFRKLREELKR